LLGPADDRGAFAGQSPPARATAAVRSGRARNARRKSGRARAGGSGGRRGPRAAPAGPGRPAPAPGLGEPRSRAALLRAAAHRAGPPAGRVAGRALDRAPSGGRRLLGGDPATLGLLAHGPSPVRLPARSSGDEAWSGRARSLHGRGPRRLARGGGAGG